jgi:hypothetical protein
MSKERARLDVANAVNELIIVALRERIAELERELHKGKAKIKNQKVEITNLNAALKEHKA